MLDIQCVKEKSDWNEYYPTNLRRQHQISTKPANCDQPMNKSLQSLSFTRKPTEFSQPTQKGFGDHNQEQKMPDNHVNKENKKWG
ncbi:MAG: hypothetical protein P8L68_13675 [Paracoccaceae bacterium]|nr:hypothetical protein [Paracoccaceae bacterium]MDG2259532.1 hypothetical protein [Paracoccaceae bacterium]